MSDTPRKAVCVSAFVLVLQGWFVLSSRDSRIFVSKPSSVVVLILFVLEFATSLSSQSIGDSWSLKRDVYPEKFLFYQTKTS